MKWSRRSNNWVKVVLRVTAFGVESLDPQSGGRLYFAGWQAAAVSHRMEWYHTVA